MWVPINSGNRSGSCSENFGFCIAQVVRRHFEKRIPHSKNYFLNSESCSENTPERSQSSENGLFTLRAFFPEIGVAPRLLIEEIVGLSRAIGLTVCLRFEMTGGGNPRQSPKGARAKGAC